MTDTDSPEVFLGRQPILDRSQQLFAYELLFRSGSAENGNFASFIDGNQATATVISNAFTEFSLADALGNYQAFIKIDQGLLFSDLIAALPPHAVVLEILETVPTTEEMLTRCARPASFSQSANGRKHRSRTARGSASLKSSKLISAGSSRKGCSN